MSSSKKCPRRRKRKNLVFATRRQREDEAMRKLELKHTQEVLSKDMGNTMRRYLDKKLRKELNES